MERVEIDKNEPLQPGDVVELHFKSIGMLWLQAAQIAAIEWKLSGRKEFTIIKSSITDNNTNVVFTVRVNKTNPVIVTAVVIAGAIVAAGVIVWLTLDKVYKIIETPAGKVATIGLGTYFLAVGIIALVALLRRK